MVTARDIEEWCGHRTVDFHYGHIALMDLKESADEIRSSIPNYLQYMKNHTEGTPAFTVLVKGKPVLSFGIYPIWEGLAEGWMIPSNLINRNAVATVKGARNIFYHAGTAMGLRRLQFLVRSTNLPACRFAEVLYFEREATLRSYGPEGDDYHVYARLY